MTILYSEPIMATAWWIIALTVLMLLFLVLSTVMVSMKIDDFALFFTTLTAVLLIALLVISAIGLREVETGRTRYEVILDDTYSAATLYANYEVIEQRGQIWVIEDKE